jgi:hypothetical protein
MRSKRLTVRLSVARGPRGIEAVSSGDVSELRESVDECDGDGTLHRGTSEAIVVEIEVSTRAQKYAI